MADAGRSDFVLCQITSQRSTDRQAIEVANADFKIGSLKTLSYAFPAKLFTANSGIVTKKVGELHVAKFEEILRSVISVFEAGIT